MNNERRAMLICFILLAIFRSLYHYFPTLNLLIENIRKIEKLKREMTNENRIKIILKLLYEKK